jgi:hypothetical protein
MSYTQQLGEQCILFREITLISDLLRHIGDGVLRDIPLHQNERLIEQHCTVQQHAPTQGNSFRIIP